MDVADHDCFALFRFEANGGHRLSPTELDELRKRMMFSGIDVERSNDIRSFDEESCFRFGSKSVRLAIVPADLEVVRQSSLFELYIRLAGLQELAPMVDDAHSMRCSAVGFRH
jgi:hypothetical protein